MKCFGNIGISFDKDLRQKPETLLRSCEFLYAILIWVRSVFEWLELKLVWFEVRGYASRDVWVNIKTDLYGF